MSQIWLNGQINITGVSNEERSKFLRRTIAGLLDIVQRGINPAFDPQSAEISIAPHLTSALSEELVAFDCWFDCGAEYFPLAEQVFKKAF